jgi:protein-disulfide isomerase
MLKKENKNIKKKINKQKDTIVWLFFIAGLGLFILMFLLFFSWQIIGSNSVQNNVLQKYATGPKVSYEDPLISNAKITYPKVLVDDVRKGDANAKVTIFFYCDLLSPLCKQQQAEIYKLWALYPETELRVVWKGTAATTQGILAQQAAYCANAQGKFWEYQQAVLADQNNIDVKRLEDIAGDQSLVQLVQSEFISCLQEAQMEDKIYQNIIEASDLGIDALPYFFIDNTPYRGFFTYQEIGEIIDSLIK